MQEIQLKFDAGKGGSVSLSRITAVIGDRVGAMPKPARKGFVFVGWYLLTGGSEHRITADTVLTLELLGGEVADALLVAKWEKPAAASVAKKKTSLATQKRAIGALVILTVVLIVALVVTGIIVDIYEYTDVDGVEYTIKKKKGVYGLYRNGVICDVDKDGYFLTASGTMLDIDDKTGEYEVYAVVDTEGTEELSFNRRVLMFKQLTYDQSSTQDLSRVIKEIAVQNEYGSYVIKRGTSNRFDIVGHDSAVMVDELFAKLANACGHTLAMDRLKNPVRLPDGSTDFSEYGLVSETRVKLDENGQEILNDNGTPVTYEYKPAKYTITAMTGEAYTVTVGDATISGAGYYALYEGRDTVYILSAPNLDDAFFQPIEALVIPVMVYPMSANSYFQVSNFVYRSGIDHKAIHRDLILQLVGFDIDTLTPDEEGNFSPEDEKKLEEVEQQLSEALEQMTDEAYGKLYDELFARYSDIVTAFSYVPLGERKDTLFSSVPYQMATKYMDGYLPNSDNIGMVLQKLYAMSFVGVTALSPDADDFETYGLDLPAHDFAFIYKDAEGQEHTNHFIVSAKTEDGLYYAFSEYYDMIVCFEESQAEYLEWEEIDWYEREYFMANIAHVQTVKLEGAGLPTPLTFTLDNSRSDQSNGMNSDELRILVNGQLMDYKLTVTKPTGSQAVEDEVYNFKRLYQALLTASMEGAAELSEEEMAALRAQPDSKCLLKMTICADDGKGTTKYAIYRFYRYTERKAYMTIETLDSPTAIGDPTKGQGTFYVLQSFCEKLMADALRYMDGQEIVIDSKT